MSSYKSIAQTALNSILVLCAFSLVALVAYRELGGAGHPARNGQQIPLKRVDDWQGLFSEGQRMGPIGAPVGMVIFSDYQCPACRALHQALSKFWSDSSLKYSVVYRHWPLPRHQFAESAAVASVCAGKQGSFENMHSMMFEHQQKLGVIPWRDIATQAGVMDLDEFEACLGRDEIRSMVRQDAQAAWSLESRGTPSIVFRGGTTFAGVPTKRVIDSILNETGSLETPKF